MIKNYIQKLQQQKLENIPLDGALDLLSRGYEGHCLWQAKIQQHEAATGNKYETAKIIIISSPQEEKK